MDGSREGETEREQDGEKGETKMKEMPTQQMDFFNKLFYFSGSRQGTGAEESKLERVRCQID